MNSTSDSSASTVVTWPLILTFVISPVLSSTSPLRRVRRSYHSGYFFFADFFIAFFAAGFFFAFFTAGFFSRRRAVFFAIDFLEPFDQGFGHAQKRHPAGWR